MPSLAEISMRLTRLAIVTAPALFVLLWSTGFIGARYGLPDIEPLTFLAVRMGFVVLIMVRDRDNRGRCEGAIANIRTSSTGYGHIIKERSRNGNDFGPSWTQTVFNPFPGSPSTYCR
jgi:hypothetical protein